MLGGFDLDLVNLTYGGAKWIPMADPNSVYWNLYLDSISFSYITKPKNDLHTKYTPKANQAIFDINTNYISLPSNDYQNIIVD